MEDVGLRSLKKLQIPFQQQVQQREHILGWLISTWLLRWSGTTYILYPPRTRNHRHSIGSVKVISNPVKVPPDPVLFVPSILFESSLKVIEDGGHWA